MTPKEVLEFSKEQGPKFVDLKVHGLSRNVAALHGANRPAQENNFEDGFGFDGSSIRGWQAIHASDMLVVPNAATAVMDPFYGGSDAQPDLQHRGSHHERNTSQSPQHFPEGRGVPEVHRDRGHRFLRAGGEFFIFDDIRYDSTQNSAYYFIDSVEGQWNTGRVETQISVTNRGTRKATFRYPPRTACTTSAP